MTQIIDPTALLRGLDTEAIERRLDELGEEAASLRSLLRSARARDRAARRRANPTQPEEVAHASQ